MITEIPTAKEFIDSGLSLLGFAWGNAMSLLISLDQGEYFGSEMSDEDVEAFWRAAKQNLSTSASITQQGVEHILKGKIVEVSPFLLIAGNPGDWPKLSNRNEINFADFHTVEAQYLPKVHDTCVEECLPVGFKEKFGELRKMRNSIIHTVDNRITPKIEEVIVNILTVHKYLFPKDSWIKARRMYLEQEPVAKLLSTEHVEGNLVEEILLLVDRLGRNQLVNHFNFDKKIRRYICPKCFSEVSDYTDSEDAPRLAQLKPNTSDSTNLYCFVCNEKTAVERVGCDEEDCSGNVHLVDYGMCATCGSHGV